MNANNTPKDTTRREFLQNMALAFGLTTLAPTLVAAAEKLPNKHTNDNNLITAQNYHFISHLSDIILPATETPGAVLAGVPAFISFVVTSQMACEHQQSFILGLNELRTRANKKNTEFVTLSNKQQFRRIQQMDKQAYSSKPPQWAESYRQLKSMILFGYYTSESGATQELIYSAVPGPYRGCVSYQDIGRSWAT